MVTVKISEGVLENALLLRLNELLERKWMDMEQYTKYADEIHEAVYGGYLEGVELDIKEMVDNLVVNEKHLVPQEEKDDTDR